MTRSAGLAVLAGLALAPVDYTIVAATFLYRPLGGEIVLALVAVVFLAGVLLRRGALIYMSQLIAIAPVLVRMIERAEELDGASVSTVAVSAAGVGALAWVVARGLVRRSRPDVT